MKKAVVKRKTRETDITIELSDKGSCRNEIKTPIGFLDHMLDEFACHGGFHLKVKAKGDVEVDDHHTVEDVGICLGEAVRKIRGKGKGIKRFGWAVVPMDEALVLVAVDLSGRPFINFSVRFSAIRKAGFDYRLFEDFFRAVSNTAEANIHILSFAGRDNHHISEAIFKAFGKALEMALSVSGRKIPSTKGRI